ncbi:MAG TPA: response regulator [Gaiellaceae bacterium]|nr:response regulator [Gaiellaceae bacterium]
MLSLLICDDSPEARELIRASLAGHPEVEIVAEAEDGEEAIALAAATRPDVVLMDVRMPVLDGIDATRRIRELLPRARIVAYAGSDDADDVTAMMEAGADAYCVKGAPRWELERALAGASDPLMRLAHAISRSVKGGGIAELVARELAELTGASFAATYLASEGSLSLVALAGPAAPDSFHSAPGVVARAFTELRLARADTHELGELYRLGAACADAVSAPLCTDGVALGAVLVVLPPNLHDRADAELVAAVADLASAALANERRLAMTYAEARRDALTGLANKRAFDERLESALSDAADRKSVSLVAFDLDDFKDVNDREGHLVGDDVLREVGRVLMRVVRADDEVFRIGGEEFAILVNGTSAVAMGVAERMRAALAEHRRGHALPTVTVGVATFPKHASSAEDLLRKADTALYAAKFAGKNRVQLFSGEQVDAQVPDVPIEVEAVSGPPSLDRHGLRLLVVDDDAALRILLRTTFEVVDIEVEEADSAEAASGLIASCAPDVVVLDVGMPGMDGLTFCRRLKADPATAGIGVVLLTGIDAGDENGAGDCGADAFLRKPFSPLELLNVVERIAGGLYEGPFRVADNPPEEQLILYAQDLRRLLEVERGQAALIQRAYRETVVALAGALESKDTGTGAHSQRVQRYAIELARELDPALLEDETVEYGFLLHDVGKIGIPDKVLLKRGSLSSSEKRLLETHTVLGEQLLSGVALLQGKGLQIVRHHHERWDGQGYPDGLGRTEIPLGARVFAVADALDAMTSDRPYRRARSWEAAAAEIIGEAGRQFDPTVVEAFRERQARLRRVHYELARA